MFRQHSADVSDLAAAYFAFHQLEHGLGGVKWIDIAVIAEVVADGFKKLTPGSYGRRRARGLPTFVIHATDQHGELGSQLNGLLRHQSITQRVQHAAESGVCLLNSGEAAVFSKLL